MEISLLEWLGYVSSIIVAISLTMSSIVKLRWYNMVGAIAFSVYGFLIGSLPVGFLNLFIVGINIYNLQKLYSKKQQFFLLKTNNDDAYLHHFLSTNKVEIENFFPNFQQNSSKTDCVYLLTSDNIPVGVFSIAVENEQGKILIDYVLPAYRDLNPGKFLYTNANSIFADLGVKQFVIQTTNKEHTNYINKMGFTMDNNGLHTLSI